MYNFIMEKYYYLMVVGIMCLVATILNLLNLLVVIEVVWVSAFLYLSFTNEYDDLMFTILSGIFFISLATSESAVGLGVAFLKYISSSKANLKSKIKKNNYFFINKKKKNFNDKNK